MRSIKVGNDKQNVFLVADTHFHHGNVIKYCNRPFDSVEEMDEVLIRNWNSVVAPNDVVCHLGDFVFHRERNCRKQVEETNNLLRKLNGRKHLILGNHDKRGTTQSELWDSIDDILQIKCFGEQSMILCHYSMIVWKNCHYGYWHAYGHSHGTLGKPCDYNPAWQIVADLLETRNSLDVGVDLWNFTPVSYGQFKSAMSKKTDTSVDHHRKEFWDG